MLIPDGSSVQARRPRTATAFRSGIGLWPRELDQTSSGTSRWASASSNSETSMISSRASAEPLVRSAIACSRLPSIAAQLSNATLDTASPVSRLIRKLTPQKPSHVWISGMIASLKTAPRTARTRELPAGDAAEFVRAGQRDNLRVLVSQLLQAGLGALPSRRACACCRWP